MAKTSFYLDMRGRAKDGKGSVLISLYHNTSTAMFPTGIRVLSDNWDYKKHCIVKTEDAVVLNLALQEQKTKIDKAVAMLSLSNPEYAILSASDIKALILQKPEKKKHHLISDLFHEYTELGDLSDGTKEIYGITLRKIESFRGSRAVIEDVDLKWLRAFDKYLSQTQCANGRSIYLRSFRAVCNYAKNLKIQFEYPFSMFKIKSEETKKRSVSVDLLREFYRCPADKKESECRDYFFLMFFLIGISAKDLFLAKKSQVVDGRLEYLRAKTGRKYSIRIEPEARILLDKYSGKGDNLIGVMDRFQLIKSALKVINRKIRDIEVVPGISTYYSRHCWATFAHEIGIPMDTISQAMGHSFGHRTTLIYVKPDQSKVDEANRKVIDYLLGG